MWRLDDAHRSNSDTVIFATCGGKVFLSCSSWDALLFVQVFHRRRKSTIGFGYDHRKKRKKDSDLVTWAAGATLLEDLGCRFAYRVVTIATFKL